jgi:hypothetical protein
MAIASAELTILNELAKITATRCEWLAIAATVTLHIRNPEFSAQYQRLLDALDPCYQFTNDMLSPFTRLSTLRQFENNFANLYDDYQQGYLLAASKPRHAADQAYEIFLGLMQRREFSTTFPLLQRTFDRLDYFVDKYVTNDAWLVMSIDAILKRLSRFLHEVAELKGRDQEESFLIYNTLMQDVAPYLQLLNSRARH